jgi:hypothetical protein
MNAKQKEQLGFIEVANDLNQEIYEKHGDVEDKFYYSTDGYVDIFGFGDIMLWNSEMDDRQFIEDKNDWLVEAIEKEQEDTNRPSFNNTVESILVSYFKAKEKKNKNVISNTNSE